MMVTCHLDETDKHRKAKQRGEGSDQSFLFCARNELSTCLIGQGKKVENDLCFLANRCDQHILQSVTLGNLFEPLRRQNIH